jgi:thiol-disulfide isomerase/thioredoxin
MTNRHITQVAGTGVLGDRVSSSGNIEPLLKSFTGTDFQQRKLTNSKRPDKLPAVQNAASRFCLPRPQSSVPTMARKKQQMTWNLSVALHVVMSIWCEPVDGKEAVVKLTGTGFESRVLKGSGWAFVKFFAPWCQHCSEMGPAWTQMAEYFKKNPIPGKLRKNI